MQDFPRQKLKELIAIYGTALCNDPARCRGMLLESCVYYQAEVQALMVALEEQIPAELLQSTRSVPYMTLLARLAKRLQDNRGMAVGDARWAIDSWAFALGILPDESYSDATMASGETAIASYNQSASQTTEQNPFPNAAFSASGGMSGGYQNQGTPAYSSPDYPPVPSYTPPPPPSTYAPVPSTVPPTSGPKKSRTGMFVIIGVVAVLLVASFIGLFALITHNPPLVFSPPTPTLTATPSPTPTPVPYPSIASSYSGTAKNTTGNLNANIAFTSVTQNKGNTSGDLAVGLPLEGSGPFQGSVTTAGAVRFVVTSNDGSNITLTLTGSIASDGSMSGTYTVSNGQKGTWTAGPESSPVVYPTLYTKYSGQYYNSSQGTTGSISLTLSSQSGPTISGSFVLSGVSYPLTGSVTSDNTITFNVTSSDGTSIDFTGTVNTDGSLKGTYTVNSGGNGTWNVTPG